MEAYDPAKVFSSIDHHGRYAYGNQPLAAQWNLSALAEALLPVLEQEAEARKRRWRRPRRHSPPSCRSSRQPVWPACAASLASSTERAGDVGLAEDLLDRMAANSADFTLTFRRLCDAAAGPEGDQEVRALFADPSAYDAWAADMAPAPGPKSPSRSRNALRACDRQTRPSSRAIIMVEAAIDAAVRRQDFQPFEELLDVVSRPYEDQPDRERYTPPARPEECVVTPSAEPKRPL